MMTWNIDAVTRGTGDCTFVLPHVLSHHVVCLQEVTPAVVEWLTEQLPDTYTVLTPQRQAGRAWPHEGHDVAMVIDSQSLVLRSCKVVPLESEQQRCVFIAKLLCLRSGSMLVVGTAHLESGKKPKPYNLRVLQLRSALSVVDGPTSGCSVLAGDLNLREWEWNVAKVVWECRDGSVGGRVGRGARELAPLVTVWAHGGSAEGYGDVVMVVWVAREVWGTGRRGGRGAQGSRHVRDSVSPL